MTLNDVINQFNTTPFLFVGSGLTRRYLDLPDWKGLLEHFASIVRDDAFAYNSYVSRAMKMETPVGLMPAIADLIQADFDRAWFDNAEIRTLDKIELEKIRAGGDPFKHEVAAYIKKKGIIQEKYAEEIDLLRHISEKGISGVITTNYDTFLEDTFSGFKKYVGQKQLIFSPIQGIAEIYKIHGSVEQADSLVINQQDYVSFMEDSAYLAAKLMTIFVEYPIIFLGYSISDPNIQEIMKSIVHCLDDEQLKALEDRFVFVEYKEGFIGAEVSPHSIVVGEKAITMKKVTLDNFGILYKALDGKRAKLPVRLLRRFKEELYDYTITSTPTSKLRVASLEDQRVDDDELVLAIGSVSEFGLKGLSGLDGREWFRNIVLDDIEFTADELLQYAFPKVAKDNAGRLPVNKYLYEAKGKYPEVEKIAERYSFDGIISATIKRGRKYLGNYTSVSQIWAQEKENLEKATRLIAHLQEDQIDVGELETILKTLFEEDVNILVKEKQAVRTNIRRLIMIYDYLKWGKKKEHSDCDLCKQTPNQDTPGSE